MIALDGSARSMWQHLYHTVLEDGTNVAPRGRLTRELRDVQYSMTWDQHFDPNPVRQISLPYIFREFLWFISADRYDTRMTEYAPIWKTCIGSDGGINSNYGQYLFPYEAGSLDSPFFNALDRLAEDQYTRRCWVPIFQSDHQTVLVHDDYPCTTGMGFSREDDYLVMRVHMRSQDLYWGAGNDEPVCYLLQLVAHTYLRIVHNVYLNIGRIIHTIDSLHLYDRHWNKAYACVDTNIPSRQDVRDFTSLTHNGFTVDDFMLLFRFDVPPRRPSPLLHAILNIPGEYGYEDSRRSWK